MVNRIAILLALGGSLLLAGCSGMNSTEQRTLSGGAIGAGVGTVGGALGGCTLCGTAAGGALGAGGGYLYDQHRKGNL